MGYYTKYDLEVFDGKGNQVFGGSYEEEIGGISEYGDRLFCDEVKWYDSHKDMLLLSLAHPDKIFVLYGVGENPDDFWRSHYKKGKACSHKGKITFPEYQESELE